MFIPLRTKKGKISIYSDDGISEMPNHHGENGACLEEVEVMLANGDSYGMQSCQTS